MSTSFADLGVPARLVQALSAAGITEPFPVQAVTLPDALAGRDLCGRAPTGSGKTLGFGIPMMIRISQAEPTKPTGLVLVPTRELAEQVQRAFVPLGRAQWRFIQAIYGGASFGPQIHSLRKGASVIVATPGRLLDIIEKGYCDLSNVEVCVIDEADRMADLGFMPDVRKLLDMTPSTRQTMLWSATLDGDVNELIRDYMNDPVRHDLLADVEAAPVDHRFVVTRPTERLESTAALIAEHGPTIVFVKTRFGVEDVCDGLNALGVRAGALHGARSQAVRQRTLEDFKRGRLQALVATDVAARGIHVDNVSLVLHYDMPDNDKDYTHRSGRTGRAGNAGLVIALVPPSRQRLAQRMSDAIASEVVWERNEPAGREHREPRNDNRDRDDRGARSDRAPRADRADRGDRSEWTPRPRRDDRNPRTDRPTERNDRNDWTPRPRRDDWTPRPTRDDRGDRPTVRTDRKDWTPRPRPDDRNGRPARNDRTEWAPRPRRDEPTDRNNWTPRPRRDEPTDRNNWTPRPARSRFDDRNGTGTRAPGDRSATPAGRYGPAAANRPSSTDRRPNGPKPGNYRGGPSKGGSRAGRG